MLLLLLLSLAGTRQRSTAEEEEAELLDEEEEEGAELPAPTLQATAEAPKRTRAVASTAAPPPSRAEEPAAAALPAAATAKPLAWKVTRLPAGPCRGHMLCSWGAALKRKLRELGAAEAEPAPEAEQGCTEKLTEEPAPAPAPAAAAAEGLLHCSSLSLST